MIEIMVHVDIPAVEKLAGAIMAMGTKRETTTEEPHPSAPQALPPSPKGEGLKALETKAEEAKETPAQPEAPEEAAEAAGESEREGHRHRPLWYVVEERHEYLDWERVGCIVDE